MLILYSIFLKMGAGTGTVTPTYTFALLETPAGTHILRIG